MRRSRLCASDQKVNMEKMNAENSGKMYEVLKFVEYGGYCRQSMDCVHGMLLIDRMKNDAVVDKAVLFGWFQKIAVCAEQYERCGAGQNYKYLNPYGIVLSDEGEVLFLDTEARGNAEVMKQMQKRAVRSHFIRPVYEMDTCGSRAVDLFGYGNTLRFMLAYMKVVPALTRREEIRLLHICGKCIGETRKKYGSFQQVSKDLPVVRENVKQADKKHIRVWAGIAAGAAVCLLAAFYMGDRILSVQDGETITGADIEADIETDIETDAETDMQADGGNDRKIDAKTDLRKDTGTDRQADAGDDRKIDAKADLREKIETGIENSGRKTGAANTNEMNRDVSDDIEASDAAAEWMELYLDQHTDKGNQKAVEIGEKARLSVLWKLADAYGQSGMKLQQIQTYGQLIELEQDPMRLEEAGVRKMELEAEQGDYKQAAETGKEVLQRIEDSEKITKLLEGYTSYKGKEDLS